MSEDTWVSKRELLQTAPDVIATWIKKCKLE